MESDRQKLIERCGYDPYDSRDIVRHIIQTSNGQLEGVDLFDRLFKNCEMIYREKIEPYDRQRAIKKRLFAKKVAEAALTYYEQDHCLKQ